MYFWRYIKKETIIIVQDSPGQPVPDFTEVSGPGVITGEGEDGGNVLPDDANKTTTKGKKTPCALCDSPVVNLPRHLKDHHRVLSAKVPLLLGVCKTLQTDDVVGKCSSCSSATACSFVTCPTCGRSVRRLDKHLRSAHGIRAGCAAYVRLMGFVKVPSDATESHSPPVHGMAGEMDEFLTWYQGIGGGFRGHAQAVQAKRRVEEVLVDFGNDFTEPALVRQFIHMESTVIPRMLNKSKPGTVYGYLNDFSKFVEWGYLRGRSWVTGEAANRIQTQIKSWNTSLQKKITQNVQDRKALDADRVLGPEVIAAWRTGDRAVAAQRLLGNNKASGDTNELGNSSYVMVRNYLIVTMTLSNACRAGPVRSMTVGEVSRASSAPGGRKVVLVKEHKTSSVYGPQHIGLSEQDFGDLGTFISKLRPAAVRAGVVCDRVFLTWKGTEMSGPDLAMLMKAEFQRTGTEKAVGFSLLRKSAVTMFRDMRLGGDQEGDLASLMKHSVDTQQKIYDVSTATDNMARTSGVVEKLFNGLALTAVDLDRNGKLSGEATAPTASSRPTATGPSKKPTQSDGGTQVVPCPRKRGRPVGSGKVRLGVGQGGAKSTVVRGRTSARLRRQTTPY